MSKRSAIEDYEHFESIEASKKQIAQDTPSYHGTRMDSVERTVKTKFAEFQRPHQGREINTAQAMQRSNQVSFNE